MAKKIDQDKHDAVITLLDRLEAEAIDRQLAKWGMPSREFSRMEDEERMGNYYACVEEEGMKKWNEGEG